MSSEHLRELRDGAPVTPLTLLAITADTLTDIATDIKSAEGGTDG